MLHRRQFLIGSMVSVLPAGLAGCSRPSPWDRAAYRKPDTSHVAILEAKGYDTALPDVVLRGIKLFRLHPHGQTVVLKPNLVEYDPAGVINTHPALIAATIAAFKSLGAREVLVAEGPGHRRDNEYLLTASSLSTMLKDYQTRYVDLNYDDVQALQLRSHFTRLQQLYFPETLLHADLLVSMPKLKTHHWVGATLALKNMFGVIPGAVYGWPKNVLHWAGIHESILDINSTLAVPQFAIVDAIIGMEGNGPIQGLPKYCGALVFGDDLVAVDATAARLMTLEPGKIRYLAGAGQFLGNIAMENIRQIGENLESFRQDFQVIDSFRHLKTPAG